MSRIVHFELHAADPQAAVDFYENVFGWQATRWDGPEEYWLVKTGEDDRPGINGGVMKSRDGQPRTVNTVEVDSVDEYVDKVCKAGGTVVVPKMAIPGVGYVAYCTDPGHNIFGIYTPDEQAE